MAFRADFFPFLGGSCSLEAVQPVHRFFAMIGALTDWGVTQATGKNARSIDARASFHDRAVEALVERFGCINDSDKFRQSDKALWRAFFDDDARYQPNRLPYLRSLHMEKSSLADIRDARFRLEASELFWLWGEPTVLPFNVIFQDAVRSRLGAAKKTGNVRSDFRGAHHSVALSQAVSDIILYGDARLYILLSKILGLPNHPASFASDYLEELNLEGGEDVLRVIPWKDSDLDFAFVD